MKKTIFLLSYLSFNSLIAQTDTSYYKAGWGNLNYAVPESPAFKLLGTNPDNILQPTSVKSMAISVGNYFIKNGNSLPKNLAVEISPLLLNAKASLNAYNKNKFLYRARLSFGTSVADNGSYNVAEGIRFTIMDKTDLRSNKQLLDYLYGTSVRNSQMLGKVLTDYAAKHPDEVANPVIAIDKFGTDDDFKNKILQQYADQLINADSLNAYRDKMRQKLWNASIWEAGVAVMQASPDSLANHLQASKVAVWSTFGTHLSKSDQLLIGLTGGANDSALHWNAYASLGFRYYYGSNELRAFVQGNAQYINNNPGATASVGCLFNITNGLWGQFSMNFIFDNKGNVTFSPGIHIAFGTPEKKKLN